MRYIRYILDLPWWIGLPIFLFGNLLVPFGWFFYIIGLMICLFGCWTFSKLLKVNEYADPISAIICIPLVCLVMWVFTDQYFNQFMECSFGTLYASRTVLGLFFGLLGFQGFRK